MMVRLDLLTCVQSSTSPNQLPPTYRSDLSDRCQAANGMKERTMFDVAVVGAGLAGLVAADAIVRSGLSVVVIEARDRVGGRIQSVVLDGVTVEVGGRWTGPGQSAIKSLAEKIGVEVAPPRTLGAIVNVRDGKRTLSAPTHGRLATSAVPVEEVIASVRALDSLSMGVNLSRPWESENALAWDAMTVANWLQVNCSTAVAGYLGVVLEGFLPEPHETSLLHALFYLRSNHGLAGILGLDGPAHDSELFIGGAHLLPERLATRLGDAIHLRAPVEAIEAVVDGVKIHTARKRWEARFAIVALPPVLAGRIRYEPAMPPLRDYLTQRSPIRGKYSVGLTYSRAFWRDAGLSGLMRHDILFGWDPGGDEPGRLGLLIGNRASRRLALVSEQERKQTILAAVASCLGETALNPTGFAEIYWAAEPFSRGCNTYLPPGAWTGYGPAWRDPVGRIHWASSELSAEFVGQMEGAVRSGKRAAKEILMRCAT